MYGPGTRTIVFGEVASHGAVGPQSLHPQPGPQTDGVFLKALPVDQ